jgi:hypothetical protein
MSTKRIPECSTLHIFCKGVPRGVAYNTVQFTAAVLHDIINSPVDKANKQLDITLYTDVNYICLIFCFTDTIPGLANLFERACPN